MAQFPVIDVVDIPDAKLLSDEDRAALDSIGGSGGPSLPISLEDTADSESRLAMTAVEREKLAAYTVNDGKTGDAHAVREDNPHTVTAAQVGAPTVAAFDALVTDVDMAEATISALDSRLDTAEAAITGHTSDIGDLDTRIENIEDTSVQWVYGPFTVFGAQTFANMPSAVTAWQASRYAKVSLWKASRIFFETFVTTADTATGASVRHQYTTDLSGASGWTDFSGADISVETTAGTGRVSSIIDVPSGAQSQEFVLLRAAGVNGNGSGSPQISFPRPVIELTAIAAPGGGGSGVASFNSRTGAVSSASNDYTFDQIAETTGRKAFTSTLKTKLDGIESGAQVNAVASVHGRIGAVVAVSGDYDTSKVTEVTDKKYVTDAEKTRIGSAKLPDDTIAALATKADATATTSALAGKADAAATASALGGKAPLDSPTFTGTPAAPTPATGDNSTKVATTAFVKTQGYLTSVPAHTHTIADVTGLQGDLDDLQTQINTLSGGSGTTTTKLVVSNATAVNMPDHDFILVEHGGAAFTANLRIPSSWTKKPHTLALNGNPNVVNIAGGSTQSVYGASGGGLNFQSGTAGSLVTRTLIPHPDNANQWIIF